MKQVEFSNNFVFITTPRFILGVILSLYGAHLSQL